MINLNFINYYMKSIMLKAIIPINWRNTKTPPEGINFEAQLVCAMNHPYVYGGL